MSEPTVEARQIRPEEVAAAIQLGGYAYGFWKDEVAEPEIDPQKLVNQFGVFVDGQIVARLVNHPYEQVVRGVWRRASGVGGVATYAEHRRQGHVRRLLDVTFAAMRERQQAVSALYPFNQDFYAKFGWVRTNPIPKVQIECRALAHLLPLASHAGNGWRYERTCGVDALEAYQEFVRQIAVQPGRDDYNGYMRDPKLEVEDWRDQPVVLVKEADDAPGERIVAAARYELKNYGWQGINTIHDYHWINASARDRLLAFFALHDAGMPHIRLHVPPGINFHGWLADSSSPYEVQMSHIPLMVRVVDVRGALDGIRVSPRDFGGESIGISVEDRRCPWVSGCFQLVNEEGVLRVKATAVDTALALTIEGITALAYGTHGVAEIAYRAWMRGLDARSREVLEAWFPERSVFNLLDF